MESVIEICGLCRRGFKFGPHAYEGRHFAAFQMPICRICESANHDGIAPAYESAFLQHLESQKIAAPPRNSKGFLMLYV